MGPHVVLADPGENPPAIADEIRHRSEEQVALGDSGMGQRDSLGRIPAQQQYEVQPRGLTLDVRDQIAASRDCRDQTIARSERLPIEGRQDSVVGARPVTHYRFPVHRAGSLVSM